MGRRDRYAGSNYTGALRQLQPCTVFEFPLHLPPRASRTLIQSLYRQLRDAIIDGRLPKGAKLPTTRALADAYGISRNTAATAYDLLRTEGYISARDRSSTYVSDAMPRLVSQRHPATAVTGTPRPAWSGPSAHARSYREVVIMSDFRLGVPDTRAFPHAVWSRLSARALREMARRGSAYGSPNGLKLLRSAVSSHIASTRAVAGAPGNIVITAGAQQAFNLLARLLIHSGKTVVAVEDPSYPPFLNVIEKAGAQIVPVPVDREGIVVSQIPAGTQVIFVTPSHQFPMGTILSMRRRIELLDFAQKHNAVIIEDDYDGEFRYDERPLEALQTLDRSERVFYVGTFSKTLFPELRLGFIVAPQWAVRDLLLEKQELDWHCPVHPQETLAAFIVEGHLTRHVRKMRGVYAKRRSVLLQRLSHDFAGWCDIAPSAAGLHLTATLRQDEDSDLFVQKALELGVNVCSLLPFYRGANRQPGLVFGFSGLDEKRINYGLDRLLTLAPASVKR